MKNKEKPSQIINKISQLIIKREYPDKKEISRNEYCFVLVESIIQYLDEHKK